MTVAENQLLALTADIVAAHVANNSVSLNDVSRLILTVHASLSKFSESSVENAASVGAQKPAVTIRASIKPHRLICLEDGQAMIMLKRHLREHHGMTPDQYRQKWKLPADYPMSAPDYQAKRSALAKASGLGRKTPMPLRRKLQPQF